VVNAISLLGGVQAMLAMAVADLVIGALTVLWIPVGKGLRGAGLFGIRITGSNPAASITGALGCGLAAACLAVLGLFSFEPAERVRAPIPRNGQIHGEITFPVGTPLAVTEAALGRVELAVLKLPNIDTVRTYAGSKTRRVRFDRPAVSSASSTSRCRRRIAATKTMSSPSSARFCRRSRKARS